MWERLLQKLKEMSSGGGKRPLKETMLILFLSGILMFVIFLPTEKNNSSYPRRSATKQSPSATDGTQPAAGKTETDVMDEYKKGLEEELEDFLSGVAGVGEVKVLIYMKESQEYIVEKDRPISSSKDSGGSQESREETTVYTRNDNGDEVPFIARTDKPAVNGVAVAAEGAYSEAVRLQIVKLVMALYGVEANKVEVTALMRDISE